MRWLRPGCRPDAVNTASDNRATMTEIPTHRMPGTTLIATRESRLALWQAEFVRDLLTRRDRKSTRLNSSHERRSRMPSSA